MNMGHRAGFRTARAKRRALPGIAEKGVVWVITKIVFLEEGEIGIFEKSGKACKQGVEWELWDGNGTYKKNVSSVP